MAKDAAKSAFMEYREEIPEGVRKALGALIRARPWNTLEDTIWFEQEVAIMLVEGTIPAPVAEALGKRVEGARKVILARTAGDQQGALIDVLNKMSGQPGPKTLTLGMGMRLDLPAPDAAFPVALPPPAPATIIDSDE